MMSNINGDHMMLGFEHMKVRRVLDNPEKYEVSEVMKNQIKLIEMALHVKKSPNWETK